MAQLSLINEAKIKLQKIMEVSVDGPAKLVADAILRGPSHVRELALSGGLVSNELRQIAWPYLLSDGTFTESADRVKRSEKDEMETFKQIELDVPRSVPEENRVFVQAFLIEFFQKQNDLCFFQGFVDIAWTVLQVMGESEQGTLSAHFVLGRLSRDFFLRDAHRSNFDAVYSCLESVRAIIVKMDKDLAKLWEDTEATNFWAISPLVCLFAHDLSDISVTARILDAIIASEKRLDFPIFLVASLVLLPNVRAKLLEGESDAASIHETLLESARDIRNIEELVDLAITLREKVPPRFVLRIAQNYGLPSDSILLRNQPFQTPTLLSKKRSWRTYTFFTSSASNYAEINAKSS